MAYAATQTRNMDRALAAETAAKEAETARVALADAKVKADDAEVAARNLADVSGFAGEGASNGGTPATSSKPDSSLGEKIGIAIFFVLLAAALLFWWFQYGRSVAFATVTSSDLSLCIPPSTLHTYCSLAA